MRLIGLFVGDFLPPPPAAQGRLAPTWNRSCGIVYMPIFMMYIYKLYPPAGAAGGHLGADVDTAKLAELTENYSGAGVLYLYIYIYIYIYIIIP